jgi:hypothetical protein
MMEAMMVQAVVVEPIPRHKTIMVVAEAEGEPDTHVASPIR